MPREKPVAGRIVDMLVRTSMVSASPSGASPPQDYYYPVFEFTVDDGKTRRVESSVGSWPKPYEVGERVEVRYDPGHPLNARIDAGFIDRWLGQLIAGFLGAILTAISSGLLYVFRKPDDTAMP